MIPTPRHIGINADDLNRARNFYQRALGWKIEPARWPDWFFVAIDGVLTGGLAKRRALIEGERTATFEITIAVEDIRATLAAAEARGARVLMRPSQVPDGPEVAYFSDPDGNLCGLGQYPRPGVSVPTLRHFAINADDVQRSKAFYEAVFGWSFMPWGPPDYYVANLGGVHAALQERRELVAGVRTNGFEPSFAVNDIRKVLEAVKSNGGRLLMPPILLEGVGDIGYCVDTEDNIFVAVQYVRPASA